MTPAASGTLSYHDVEDIVESLVNTEGRKYPIPGYDFEDTAQEIRTECLRVLCFYDPERIGPSPYSYLRTCVRNFLYNQRRGIWVPNNPPCVRCPLWDKVNKTCTIEEVGCEPIAKYRENMARKAEIRQPASLEVDVAHEQQEQELDAIMLDQSIRSTLPDHLLEHYEQMLKGEKVAPRIKKQIREFVLVVINNA